MTSWVLSAARYPGQHTTLPALGGPTRSITSISTSNALVTARRVTIIDWEEAVVGFPACSLDRLIDDATEFDDYRGAGLSPTGAAVVDAYAHRVRWGDHNLRHEVSEEAIRLNRTAFAGQALDFWRERGRPFGHPEARSRMCRPDRHRMGWHQPSVRGLTRFLHHFASGEFR